MVGAWLKKTFAEVYTIYMYLKRDDMYLIKNKSIIIQSWE